MNQISIFYTLFWCIYFPTCIAYNDLPGFSYVDEVMTGILVIYTFSKMGHWSLNSAPWKEFFVFILVLFFFTGYGLMFGRNVAGGVWLDFIQELRPYSVIYCTWILNPRFSGRQKRLMLLSMVVTLFSWIYYHPETLESENAEFPVLGQMAICTGMTWYMFNKESQMNKIIALGLVLTGMFAPKFKFMGEVVCFIALIFFLKKQLEFKSIKTAAIVGVLMAVVLYVTWERFDTYYVRGFTNSEYRMARPETYRVAFTEILWDYFPLGSGMGTFACNGAWRYYSPLYHEYNLDTVWGLDKGGGFIADAYYPTLAQFGVVGVFFFCWFWKRRLVAMNAIEDMKYYRVAFMTFFCLAIEQTADSSWLSGKGMGYCMLLALCLNSNLNSEEDEEDDELESEEIDEIEDSEEGDCIANMSSLVERN